MPQDDISKRLNIPIGTVKSRLHYAKEKFKQHYPYKKASKGEAIMKTKRFLALLLSVMMVLGMMPMTVLAYFEEPSAEDDIQGDI